MKKTKKNMHAKERHDETCMCKRCRGRMEASFGKRQRKAQLKNVINTSMSAFNDYD